MEDPPMEPLALPLWSEDEKKPTAAKVIGCGRTRIKELVASGELPSIKDGGRRLVLVADIRERLERLRRDQNAESTGKAP
jgi:excisionase family DNA binding protein